MYPTHPRWEVDLEEVADMISYVAKILARRRRYEAAATPTHTLRPNSIPGPQEATKLVRTALETDFFPLLESEAPEPPRNRTRT